MTFFVSVVDVVHIKIFLLYLDTYVNIHVQIIVLDNAINIICINYNKRSCLYNKKGNIITTIRLNINICH